MPYIFAHIYQQELYLQWEINKDRYIKASGDQNSGGSYCKGCGHQGKHPLEQSLLGFLQDATPSSIPPFVLVLCSTCSIFCLKSF